MEQPPRLTPPVGRRNLGRDRAVTASSSEPPPKGGEMSRQDTLSSLLLEPRIPKPRTLKVDRP
eukprot:3995897-Pleurochrysis_carterae.AAC.1